MFMPRTERIVIYTLATVFALFGALKFILLDFEAAAFEGWGYPAWFAFVVGAWELATAALLLWPRGRFWGAEAGAMVMAGAVMTHLRVPEIGLLPLAVPVLVATGWLAWQTRPRAALLVTPSR